MSKDKNKTAVDKKVQVAECLKEHPVAFPEAKREYVARVGAAYPKAIAREAYQRGLSEHKKAIREEIQAARLTSYSRKATKDGGQRATVWYRMK